MPRESGRGLLDEIPNDLQSIVQKVTAADTRYQLAKFLFLGVFMKRPNDLFSDNYERIRSDVISAYYNIDGSSEDRLFDVLFRLMERGKTAIEEAAARLQQQEHSKPLARIFLNSGVKYQATVLLLSLSGALAVDLSARVDDARDEAARIDKFLSAADDLLRDKPQQFDVACRWAVNTLMNDASRDNEDPRKTKQYLFGRIEEGSFTRFYQSLRRTLDLLD